MTDTRPVLAPAPLLPGQAAAPPGACDLTGMYLMHHGFRRDLARFRVAARRTPLGDTATWQRLAARWDRFAGLLHEHHHKEDDGLWPVLTAAATAAGDTEALRVLHAMEAEHAVLDPLLDQARRGWAAGGVRVELPGVLDRLARALDEHLAHEERDAVAVIQRHLDAAAWARLEAEVLRGDPSPGAMLFLLPWLADGVPADLLAPFLAEAGAVPRALLALTRRPYARAEARTFTHIPPGTGVADLLRG